MAPTASTQRRSSALTVVALGAVALTSTMHMAFTGNAAAPAGRAVAPKTQMKVNLFEGLPSINFGEKFDAEEAGTRSARVADTDNTRLVECSMPLGVGFEERNGGDIYIKSVDPDSDAYAQGVRPGAQLSMISATFGDEMWNAERVGMTQFMTVLNSRFGSTISLALKKEDQNVLQSFFESLAPKVPETAEDKKKQANLQAEFEAAEKGLGDKNMWNPFR